MRLTFAPMADADDVAHIVQPAQPGREHDAGSKDESAAPTDAFPATASLHPPQPILKLDLRALEDDVYKELLKINSTPPSKSVKHAILNTVHHSDELMFIASALDTVVRHAVARSLIDEFQEKHLKVDVVSTRGPCLNGYRVVRKLGNGVDGTVYLLENGKAAKISMIRLHDEDYLDYHIEAALQEIKACRLAGKYKFGPQVHNAWFCMSATSAAYVIVMDQVEGGIDLFDWAEGRSPREKEDMQSAIDSIVESMHSVGLYHNDLHAHNVMVDRNNKPWIIDFSRCTLLDTFSKLRSKWRDKQLLHTFLSPKYAPFDVEALTQYITGSLHEQGMFQLVQNPSTAPQNISASTHAPTAGNTSLLYSYETSS